MPSDEYDHYYKPPWATSRALEQKHRDISQEIGISLKGKRGHSIRLAKSLDFVQTSSEIIFWETSKTKVDNIFVLLDVGVLAYILLYSLTLYNVSDETLGDWKTVDRDRKKIKNVRNYFRWQ